jgi:hypothetical protein
MEGGGRYVDMIYIHDGLQVTLMRWDHDSISFSDIAFYTV